MGEVLLDILRFLTTTYVGAIFWLLVALYMTYSNLRNPLKMQMIDPLQGAVKGWVAVVGAFALGVIIVYLKLKGEL
jgi:hypothetical protein